MSLSLLAPFAIGLAALAALPIVAHLSRQTPRDRVPFGAMLLLERVIKRLRRRRRVRDPLLLLIRVLAVLAIVAAGMGPQFSWLGGIPEHGGSGRVVLVVDRSMSMSAVDGGVPLLELAKDQAADALADLPDGTAVGLVSYGRQGLALTPELTNDHGRLASLLEGIGPSHETSDLTGALNEARRLLGGEPGEVLLFTDEAGPSMVTEAQTELGHLVERGSVVIPMPVHMDPARNVAVSSATYDTGTIVIRLVNYGPVALEVACEVTLPDGAQIPVFVDLPPAGEAEERLTVPNEVAGGVGSVRCQDPDLPADDGRFFHLPRVGTSRVLVVDGDPGDTPTRSEVYFLERALAPWGGQRGGISLDVTAPAGLMGLSVDTHRVVILANVADPRPFASQLTRFVREGGALVVAAGDNVTADRYNAALGSVLPAPFRRPRSLADAAEEGVPLQLPDAEHPLFETFSGAGRAGFGRVRSHRILTLEQYADRNDELATLLRYEGGAPALVERRIGRGRVMVWTSTMDWSWTNLPLQSVFMPLTQQLVAYLGGDSGAGASRFDGLVGETLRIPLPDLSIEPEVIGPDGSVVSSRIEGAQLLFQPDEPGAYALSVSGTPALAWVAVNTDLAESDVRRTTSVAETERSLDPERFTRTADLSPGLLGFGLGLLLLASVLSIRRPEMEDA